MRQAVLRLFLFLAVCLQIRGAKPSWADFVEPDFPFYSSVLDARKLGSGSLTNNLTPRGLVLNLGAGCWACFDTELLRVSAVWQGKGVSPVSMAQGSYHRAGEKAPEGQTTLPQILGTPWLLNGLYPGWQSGNSLALNDPRSPGPEPRDVGRGPLKDARFHSIDYHQRNAVLAYEVEGVLIEEELSASGSGEAAYIQRRIHVGPHPQTLSLLVGKIMDAGERQLFLKQNRGQAPELFEENGVTAVRLASSSGTNEFLMTLARAGQNPAEFSNPPAATRWPVVTTTAAELSKVPAAFVLDRVNLPTNNVWKRNVRFADIGFFSDGRAAVVTFDGDVWLVNGLKGNLDRIEWRRFASGFHEPLALAIRRDELFVFDRNGIWRVLDADKDGEADRHELFCNLFTQTAETREFACGMRVAPDGSFVIAKGGQQTGSLGRDNGSIIRISPDGRNITTLGWGLRQPFLGIHPKTGLITASDQQGHYVPSTPLHIISDHKYYGFIPTFLPKEKYPAEIADPLTWIPHPINASGASQVWLENAKLGPLNGALIHLGYYRPEMFLVLLNDRGPRPQAAVTSLTRDFWFPPLNGAVNPVDGQLYVIGFQIWGTTAPDISGLARYRYRGGASTLPRAVVPMDKGIMIEFGVELDSNTVKDLRNYSAERWNYVRTANYGSPHFRLDGSKGQEFLPASAGYLSTDRRKLFVAIPDMRQVMQMRLGWTLKSAAGDAAEQNVYFTPYYLEPFDPSREGFGNITVDLSRKEAAPEAKTEISAKEGQRLYELMGCVACHSVDGSTVGKVGPSWKGVFGTERTFADGKKAMADESYIRESIKEPALHIVKGFDKSDTGMPSYEGVLTPDQIESLVLFIKTLR